MEKEGNYKVYALFGLLAFSGMRKGEALALKWTDINFKTKELKVNKAVGRGIKNKLYLKTTKTGESRTLKMDEETLQILKHWKKKQQRELLAKGFNAINKEQLIFSNNMNSFIQPTKTQV